MLTRQVLESQRKQTQKLGKVWQIEMSADKLWCWASAWLKAQAGVHNPAPSLRYPGWVSGQLAWAGPKPWLELPFSWEMGRFFRIEQSAGPRAYLHWEIECQPLSSTRARLVLKCHWQWSKASVLQTQWQSLCRQVEAAVPVLEALQQSFPVANEAQLQQAGKHLLTLFGYAESTLVQQMTGAANKDRWHWFQRLIHEQGFESACLQRLSAKREMVLKTWHKTTLADELRLVFLHPDLKPLFTCEGLRYQRYLWPQQEVQVSLQKGAPLPWRACEHSERYYLAHDRLAPREATQCLPTLPEKTYQYIHPEGTLKVLNTALSPVVFSHGAPPLPVCDLGDVLMEPAATPYLFSHWPDNHPVSLTLTLCLLAPQEQAVLGKSLASVVQSHLKKGRVLLSSPQGLLVAFGRPLDALQWIKRLYQERNTWRHWGLLPASALQLALSEGPVQVYPQHEHWRVMGNSVRELNQAVAQSEGQVVVSTRFFSQPAVQAFCQQHHWPVYYVASTQQMHLQPGL
jgi:hypothetical protein